MDNLIYPTAVQLLGSWYLVGGTAGFIVTRPKVETVEVLATPLRKGRVRISAVCSVAGRPFRMSQRVKIFPDRGALSYGLFPGSASIMRTWNLGMTRSGDILRVTHEGSMLLGGGSLFFVASDVDQQDGRELIARTRADLGLTTRDLETMAWRRRPPVTLTEEPRWSLRQRLGYGRPDDTRPPGSGQADDVLG